MLLRKRAWDMMREDFPSIREDDTLAEAIRALTAAMKESPENHTVVVLKKNGAFRGVTTIWNVLKTVQTTVLKDDALKNIEESDWDQTFARACTVCTQTGLEAHLETDVAMLKPGDALLTVLDKFLAKKRGYAVVEEGDRVIGIVYAGDLFREIARDMVRAF
ncbi:CBS domain-containing protein [Desulfovibrio aminophilus]|uniref:CBS domain-containing protein n=1 Tax=Desulfovibrio aminophilus TaxID=81425 RepID=UPI003397BE2E